MSVSVHLEGAIQAARDYHERAQRARDLKPVMDRITDFWMSSESRQFASGAGWPDIKLKSRQWKTRRGLDPRVMRATGRLESVLTQRGMEASGQLVEVTAESLVAGIRPGRTPVFYGPIHNRKWPLISFDDIAASEANDLLGRYLATGETR